MLDGKRVEMVARNRGIRAKEAENAAKLLTAFLRNAEEELIRRLIVESVILLSTSKQADGSSILRAAAQAYKVDIDVIALKVKREFAAKEKARSVAKVEPKQVPKAFGKGAQEPQCLIEPVLRDRLASCWPVFPHPEGHCLDCESFMFCPPDELGCYVAH